MQWPPKAGSALRCVSVPSCACCSRCACSACFGFCSRPWQKWDHRQPGVAVVAQQRLLVPHTWLLQRIGSHFPGGRVERGGQALNACYACFACSACCACFLFCGQPPPRVCRGTVEQGGQAFSPVLAFMILRDKDRLCYGAVPLHDHLCCFCVTLRRVELCASSSSNFQPCIVVTACTNMYDWSMIQL